MKNTVLTIIFYFAFISLIALDTTFAQIQENNSREVVSIRTCHDGDTCKALTSEFKLIIIRFSGIDAPEIGQEYGEDARVYLQSLIGRKKVSIECDGLSYDRRTCTVYLSVHNGATGEGEIDVNEQLVRMGYAWDFPRHSGKRYANSEQLARQEHRGLWASGNVVSPFCFRHMTPYAEKKCRRNQQYQD